MTDIHLNLKQPHPGQQYCLDNAKRFNVGACGRRWGKTDMGIEHLALPAMLAGDPVGWFAPTYKLLDEAWDFALQIFAPFGTSLKVNKSERYIKLPTGGKMDFWTTQPVHAGDNESEVARGRKYKLAIYDEAARARKLKADWERAIRPTLSDLRGDAWFLTTPKGHNFLWRLFIRGESDDYEEWQSFHMPTSSNPYIHPDEIESARLELPADAFAQEYLAEFLADAANPFGIHAIRACITEGMAKGPVAAWGFDLAKSVDHTVGIGLNEQGGVCVFQRWQSDWRNTKKRIIAMIGNTPALIDSTGVGDPIVEDIQVHCPLAEGYKFTSQSKQQLMEGLAVAIQNQEISYSDELQTMINELESFQYEYKPNGVRYTAPDGMYDDCVDGLSLANRCLTIRPARGELITLDDEDDEVERMWTAKFGAEEQWI